MRSLIKNKKGDLPSLIISLIVIMFVLGLSAILFSKVFLSITGEMKQQTEFSNTTINTITSVEGKTIPFLDYLFLFSFIAISIGLIISCIFIDTHPALIVIFIVLLVIAIVLAGIFANVFVSIGEDTEIASTYNQFTFTKALITHLPLAVLIIGLLVIIVLYGKSKYGSAGPV